MTSNTYALSKSASAQVHFFKRTTNDLTEIFVDTLLPIEF